jgi:hypothetical protein
MDTIKTSVLGFFVVIGEIIFGDPLKELYDLDEYS